MTNQVKIVNVSKKKRILDFSQFLTPEMKARKESGELDWMDLLEVFEGMYIRACEQEGRKLLQGNYKSDSTDDRFNVLWEVDGKRIQGEYLFNGEWWTVVETLRN